MPRSKEQFEEIRIKSKEHIMQSALKLFSANGYHKTSTSAIAREANVASGLMYNYFSSKEELLLSILDQFFNELALSISKKFQKDPEDLDAGKVVDELIKEVTSKQEQWLLLISITFQADITKLCQEKIATMALHQNDIFEKCFALKGIQNPKENSKVLSIILHGALLNYASNQKLDELMLIRNTVIEHIINEGIFKQ